MGSQAPAIALTTGEPAGIGPDICAMLADAALPARLVALGDAQLLAQRARRQAFRCGGAGRHGGRGASLAARRAARAADV